VSFPRNAAWAWGEASSTTSCFNVNGFWNTGTRSFNGLKE
jgi:hypothetical protein